MLKTTKEFTQKIDPSLAPIVANASKHKQKLNIIRIIYIQENDRLDVINCFKQTTTFKAMALFTLILELSNVRSALDFLKPIGH